MTRASNSILECHLTGRFLGRARSSVKSPTPLHDAHFGDLSRTAPRRWMRGACAGLCSASSRDGIGA